MLNKFTGEGSGLGALFGWAGLKLTEPLPRHEVRHMVQWYTINPINKDHPCIPHTEYWHLGMLIA